MLLGAFRSLGAPELNVRLRPGDSLVLYTDGVTDAIGPSGERFGEARLLTTIEDRPSGVGARHRRRAPRCRGGLSRERPSG